MADPSVDNRAETAAKLAEQFEGDNLSDAERAMAENIFRIMVQDAEERVRAALAVNLKDVPSLSRDVAMSLAKDVSDSVALPMIQFSEALSDDDLIEIVATQKEERKVAVAGRPAVSAEVAEAVVQHAGEHAVKTLVSNEGARLNEATLSKVVDTYGEVEAIQKPLVHRAKLPITVAEKLVAKISDNLKDYLVAHHDLPEELATDLIIQSRERATIGLLSGEGEETSDALVHQLRENGRLTPSIILRALCVGDMGFYEAAMAELADIPVVNARILMHDEGDLGLRALYDRAGMPKPLYPAFYTAMTIANDTSKERTDDDPEVVMRRMLEHVLTVHEDIVDEYGIENVDYLLNKFNQI
jgi:uncharacterized protein (DUF2336 family)